MFLRSCWIVLPSAARPLVFVLFGFGRTIFKAQPRSFRFVLRYATRFLLACGYALTEHIGYAPVVSICFQLFVLPSAAEGKRLMALRPETLGSFKLRFFQRCKPAASEVT